MKPLDLAFLLPFWGLNHSFFSDGFSMDGYLSKMKRHPLKDGKMEGKMGWMLQWAAENGLVKGWILDPVTVAVNFATDVGISWNISVHLEGFPVKQTCHWSVFEPGGMQSHTAGCEFTRRQPSVWSLPQSPVWGGRWKEMSAEETSNKKRATHFHVKTGARNTDF